MKNKIILAKLYYDIFAISTSVFVIAFKYNIDLQKLLFLCGTQCLLLLIFLFCGLYKPRKKINIANLTLTFAISQSILFFANSIFISINESILLSMLNLILLAIPRVVSELNKSNLKFVTDYLGTKRPILVIGGAGYIGSYVVELLLTQGEYVRVVDQFPTGLNSLRDLDNGNLEIIKGDITNLTVLFNAMINVKAVINLGGIVGDPACALDKTITNQSNIIATKMSLIAAKSCGVNRYIFASSCSVYGVSDVEVDELADLNPVSLYAESKIQSESDILELANDDFVCTILRFATVFGHSRRPRFDLVANLFTAMAINNRPITVIGPDQWRPFIHVLDLARAVVMVLNAPASIVRSEIFNVGDKRQNLTIGELANIVKETVKKFGILANIEVIDDPNFDRRNYFVCFDKINKELGFSSSISVADGIEEIARNFMDGVYQSFDSNEYSNLRLMEIFKDQFYNTGYTSDIYTTVNASTQAST